MGTEPKQKLTRDEQFRASVKDALVVLRVLGTFCETVEEAIGMGELALTNDGQLRMLMTGAEESPK